MDAIAEHLMACSTGEIKRLLINVPPGTSKSTMTGIIFPAWLWGPGAKPETRYIGASHQMDLAARDSRRTKFIIDSDWYQERWPTKLTSDSTVYFENDKRGFRQAAAVASMTGKRGDYVLWDDPHSPEKAYSDVQRETAHRIFSETLPTRLTNPQKSVIIVVMQRLHEDDISGYILKNDLGYEHLCMPMEYEPERKCYTSIWEDWRKVEGELLFEKRFPKDVVERDKKVMGVFATAGQFQQRPAPRSGGFFSWENIETVGAAPKCERIVRYWDKAGTKNGGAYTVGVKMGITKDKDFIVMDVVRGQWAAGQREKVIHQTAILDGEDVRVWIEQEPGSGGLESATSTIKRLSGFVVRKDRVSGDKVTRAEPYAVQMEAGNIKVVNTEWTKTFIDEHKNFPLGQFKDQVDAVAGAFAKLNAGGYNENLLAIGGGKQVNRARI